MKVCTGVGHWNHGKVQSLGMRGSVRVQPGAVLAGTALWAPGTAPGSCLQPGSAWPGTAPAGMAFPNALRATEEFSVAAADRQLSQALLMDCTAHTAQSQCLCHKKAPKQQAG